jgi:U3 small nucleolar RNA-associated protein 6
MAESVVLKLEDMLPEATYFLNKGVFTEKEMRTIMMERRVYEQALVSHAYSLRDYFNYINHEIKVECDRRERYEAMNIKKLDTRDFVIVQRVHHLFNRCISKFSEDVSVWHKYIEFCSSSGSSNALSKVLMKAIRRHPRVASFRVIAADRELQQGSLVAARKMLMRAIRIKTDNQLLVWEQLFKLECAAIHKQVTVPLKNDKEGDKEPTDIPSVSCRAAAVVYRHAMKELNSNLKFKSFAVEALESLEMSIMGFKEPEDFDALRDSIRGI